LDCGMTLWFTSILLIMKLLNFFLNRSFKMIISASACDLSYARIATSRVHTRLASASRWTDAPLSDSRYRCWGSCRQVGHTVPTAFDVPTLDLAHAQSVEVTKLLAVVATLLTACSFIAWAIISSVWVSRKQACSGARSAVFQVVPYHRREVAAGPSVMPNGCPASMPVPVKRVPLRRRVS
jgi:hypothetical protein